MQSAIVCSILLPIGRCQRCWKVCVNANGIAGGPAVVRSHAKQGSVRCPCPFERNRRSVQILSLPRFSNHLHPADFHKERHGQLDRRNHIFGVTSPSFTVLLVSPHCIPTPHSLSLHCPASTNQSSSDRFEARESGIQQHGRECP